MNYADLRHGPAGRAADHLDTRHPDALAVRAALANALARVAWLEHQLGRLTARLERLEARSTESAAR